MLTKTVRNITCKLENATSVSLASSRITLEDAHFKTFNARAMKSASKEFAIRFPKIASELTTSVFAQFARLETTASSMVSASIKKPVKKINTSLMMGSASTCPPAAHPSILPLEHAFSVLTELLQTTDSAVLMDTQF